VGGIERVRDFDGQGQQRFVSKGRPAMRCFRGRAFQKFHRDEGAAGPLVDLVDGADVGMVESGSCLGFSLATAERLRVLGDVIGQKFKGNETIELDVLRFVDDAPPAATQFFDDAIVPDGLVEQSGRRCTPLD
jgi:hypothetical protein